MKTKTNTKIIFTIIIIIVAVLFLSWRSDRKMDEYAEAHNCTWTIQGSHDICK